MAHRTHVYHRRPHSNLRHRRHLYGQSHISLMSANLQKLKRKRNGIETTTKWKGAQFNEVLVAYLLPCSHLPANLRHGFSFDQPIRTLRMIHPQRQCYRHHHRRYRIDRHFFDFHLTTIRFVEGTIPHVNSDHQQFVHCISDTMDHQLFSFDSSTIQNIFREKMEQIALIFSYK